MDNPRNRLFYIGETHANYIYRLRKRLNKDRNRDFIRLTAIFNSISFLYIRALKEVLKFENKYSRI
jgi:hypothetical protein